MKKVLWLIFFGGITSFLYGQSLQNLSFGTDSTLEIVTWNLESFPKNGIKTIDSVAIAINALDVDLIALQEIDSKTGFQALVDRLDGWNGFYINEAYATLAYLYKPSVITVTSIYEIYTTQTYWRAFPRSPMVIEMEYGGEKVVVINNHLKCCGDGYLNSSDVWDEEKRRFDASIALRNYINNNFPNDQVLVVGDLNDELTDPVAHNTLQPLLSDPANFKFADMAIATGPNSGWSYPSWPSHLDHIGITNELFPEFQQASTEIKTIRVDALVSGGFPFYEFNISDHLPVALKLKIGQSQVSREVVITPQTEFTLFPNPSSGLTHIWFTSQQNSPTEMVILDGLGQVLQKRKLNLGQDHLELDLKALPEGIYFVQVRNSNKEILATKKLVIID